MTTYRHKHPAERDLIKWGPRLDVLLGPPRMSTSLGVISGAGQTTTIPALIDTGAGRTIVTPEAVTTAQLAKVDETRIARLGGMIEGAEVFVASLQFPRLKLTTIDMIPVVCCELPEQPIQCLLGRDIIARWIFTYNGPLYEWKIEERDAGPSVGPPDLVED